MRLKFDRFVFDSSTQVIHGPNSEKLVMRPQATKVLECLLRRAPDLVSKKDLLNEVWGHEALSESGVAQAIREIRKTLGEQASDPDIVGTRHGCGYYILCDVEILPEALPEV
ncbi:MAG: winged helix-turn-helix domain-containing protein, partial [Wenzhouxiangellaceae bacterium]